MTCSFFGKFYALANVGTLQLFFVQIKTVLYEWQSWKKKKTTKTKPSLSQYYVGPLQPMSHNFISWDITFKMPEIEKNLIVENNKITKFEVPVLKSTFMWQFEFSEFLEISFGKMLLSNNFFHKIFSFFWKNSNRNKILFFNARSLRLANFTFSSCFFHFWHSLILWIVGHVMASLQTQACCHLNIHLIPKCPALLFSCKLARVASFLNSKFKREYFPLNEATRANSQVNKRILKLRPFWNKVYETWIMKL